jgi:uncharacterized membrane protein
MTRGARYAVVFLFVLTLAVGTANLLFTSNLVHRATAASASVTQLCQAGNGFRSDQVQLWTFVIRISSPPPHETPAAKAQREKTVRAFEAYVRKVFKPHNCQAVIGTGNTSGTSPSRGRSMRLRG